MKNKFYLVVKNTCTNEMTTAAIFYSPSDATNVCRLLNKQRIEKGDTVHKYGVTNNPMIWREN